MLSKKQITILMIITVFSLLEIAVLGFLFYKYDKVLAKKQMTAQVKIIPSTANVSLNVEKQIPKRKFSSISINNLSAESVFVKEINSQSVIYEKNSDQKKYMASITKLITAITVRSNFNNDRVIRTDAVSTSIGDANIKLPNNTDYSIKNLLYALLMPSSNEAAYAFANNLGYSNFVEKMNSVGKALHLENSHFINPAGFDAQEEKDGQKITNETTAKDIDKMTEYFLKDSLLKDIVGTRTKTLVSTDGKISNLLNTNELLGNINGVTGVKTGTEDLAGQCFVVTYEKNNNVFLIILLHSQDRFKEAQQIISRINTL